MIEYCKNITNESGMLLPLFQYVIKIQSDNNQYAKYMILYNILLYIFSDCLFKYSHGYYVNRKE